jgi:hypothetical protein
MASEIITVDRGGGFYDWVCKACGEKVGFMLQHGTLDLGPVHAAALNPDNKWEPL